MCSRFYQWYQWYTIIVQGSTNGTIGNTIGANGNANGTVGSPNGTIGIAIGTNGKPMVPLATNGTIGRTPNRALDLTRQFRLFLALGRFSQFSGWVALALVDGSFRQSFKLSRFGQTL